MPDFEKMALNAARMVEEAGKVAAAYIRPREAGEKALAPAAEANDMVKTLGKVAEHWMSEPARAIEAQASIASSMMALWSNTLQKMNGENPAPIAEADPKDARFKDPEWSENPYFDFLKQAYLVTTRWADGLVEKADALDEHTRHKAGFYVKQMAGALSPSNFVPTNPELLRTTLQENGENLVRGLKMMAEDVEAGHGDLKIRQSQTEGFEVGVNMATTPGKVVFRNGLIELIQYTPTTGHVLKVPLVIVPPWINKFYILDLNPEKSFIKWCVDQGVTVFVISWVNPDERHAKADFETYMKDGIIAALDVAREITGEPKAHTIGYCVGGTMLAVTLAWLAARGEDRIRSTTFLTTQVDFTHAGDLRVFVDEEQINAVEEAMHRLGYLPGSRMASAFNMLRPLDLIWPYVVNTYLKGKEPAAFDLLYWNSDSTRMPEANHRYYMRNCYLENNLSRGRLELAGEKLDLGKVKTPIYNLAAKEDHIAPARSVFVGSKFFGGPVRYVLGGSGHIAGVVNPAAKGKYQFWTGGPVTGEFEDWLASAKETAGSWWLDWIAWLREQAPDEAPARPPGSAAHKPLGDAPGDYVKVKA
ncbi:MAG: class I poly(R)-hydroxyalkanoic acid synthase [Methylocystis sp.]|nr:class I poly(R)-hydroxyalkanoic acid synthase [Methylocystis sp.]MCA3584102.1 class I poly(R)-hydroxyalkanoic acid synthase [Methylocystis sp.]MCA3588938.1 class I poly(R)-hydroxyalkanoic acid synthase [Methylocystis sp.]MCA3591222.1 class I poly(R)-hydroxyalkanoic acid synthase [Methylocystis sp.]